MRTISIAIGFLLLFLAGCAEKGSGPVISSGDRYATSVTADGSSAIVDYRLDVGDKIKMTVYNEPTLTGEYTVGADGTLALPLIGDLPAKGRTVSEVVDSARMRFADGFLREPRVSGEVINYRPFYILGEVEAPGPYPYVVGLTALNAVATAKGFTPRANRDVVQIRRQGATEETNYRLTPELLVLPGDTIRVGERYF